MAKGGNVDKDIAKFKKQLIAKAKSKGLYEDFGQKEYTLLVDKYGRYGEDGNKITEFNNWASNFDLSSFSKGGNPRWIQEVTESPNFRKGAFTKKAKERGLSTPEFTKKVLSNPNSYDERTVRQARLSRTFKKLRNAKSVIRKSRKK